MAELFDGYLLSDSKVPLTSVKDKSNWLSEPPKNSDYVGILSPDIIQLDFDSKEDSKLILEIVNRFKIRCDILKTSRGIHLYLKDDGYVKSQSVGIFTAIGIPVDIGLGKKNRTVPLRTTKTVVRKKVQDGVEIEEESQVTTTREWLQEYSELDELPSFLRPISHKNYNLKESNTRNQSLFNYILVLQTFGFSKEEVRKTIKIINDFILYEPLDDKEIDTITRDDAFSSELFFSEKGKFLHDRFGDYLLSNGNIMIIDGQLCIYTMDDLYSNDPDEFERVMLDKISHLKDNQRKEVYKYINLKCKKKGSYANAKYIGLRDYILDIEKMEQFPYSPKFIINNKIDYNYDANAYSDVMDKTLDKVCCNDKEIRMLLEEMIGYSLYRQNSMQQCFILTGEGSNGKSTILNVIKQMLGKKNYSSLDLRQLEEMFAPAELYGKLANIGDDISAKYLETSSVFKKVVTGESFQVAKKYGQPFDLESYATQIFCANTLPPTSDRTDGFGRRINIIPFRAKFSKYDDDYDPFIEDKLLEDDSIKYLLRLSIDGLRRVIFNKQFTKSKVGEKEKRAYLRSNNNVLEWLDEGAKVKNEAVNDVYQTYQHWCFISGYKAISKGNFSKEIRKELNLVSVPQYVDGKTTRVYTKIKEE